MSGTVTRRGVSRQPDADTERLAQAAAGGSEEALAELYERYVDLSFRFVGVRVGDRATAEDITSELWIRVAQTIDRYTTVGGGFPAWLLTIATRLIADHYRRPAIRRESPTADMLALDSAALVDGPEAAVLSADRARLIARAVEQLSPRQRECVTLRFFVGLSIAETAAAMKRTHGSVKVLQHRALRKLGAVLAREGANSLPTGSVLSAAKQYDDGVGHG